MNVFHKVVSESGLYLPPGAQFRYAVYHSVPAYLFRESDMWVIHINGSHVTKTLDGWIYGSDWMLEWDNSDKTRPVMGPCGYWRDWQTGTRVTAKRVNWDYLKLKYLFGGLQ